MRSLVTGGGGFLGEALVRALLARGDEVQILARGDYPALRALGARTIRGDLRDPAAVADACRGVEVVFHTAAKAGGWGSAADYLAINVHGSQNVIAGCRLHGVPSLVYTSSPSIVHHGTGIEGGDESLPYARRFLAAYPRTKAMAEALIREASDTSLATISLRPHFIWGPGDRHLLPRLVERSKAGRLRRIGAGDPLSDTTYIDNCVHAHLLAADALRNAAPLGGSVYFISDDDPRGVWTMANRMLEAAGHPPIEGSVPAWLASAAGATLEAAHWLLRNQQEPLMTRFGASQLTHPQWFDISAAKRDLSYHPVVTVDEGLLRLAAWCEPGGPANPSRLSPYP